MADKKNNNKKQRQNLTDYVREEFGGDISAEIRDLIDLAVRKQFDLQRFVQRFANTNYFHRQFPGLIERGGTIANALTGEQGVGVSPGSLQAAIKNYRTALDQNTQLAQQYGFHFGKDQLAKLIKDNTSTQEFGQRLAAVATVDANPALKDAFEAQLRASGQKVTPNAAYKAALAQGPKAFENRYEGALYQQQLGLSRSESLALAKGKAINPGATLDDVGQIISQARQNLQAIAPELANQGIGAARLVKILGNPTAYASDLDKVKAVLQQRQALFGQPVQGTYAQQGSGGGLTQYQPQGEAAYG